MEGPFGWGLAGSRSAVVMTLGLSDRQGAEHRSVSRWLDGETDASQRCPWVGVAGDQARVRAVPNVCSPLRVTGQLSRSAAWPWRWGFGVYVPWRRRPRSGVGTVNGGPARRGA